MNKNLLIGDFQKGIWVFKKKGNNVFGFAKSLLLSEVTYTEKNSLGIINYNKDNKIVSFLTEGSAYSKLLLKKVA